MIDLTPVLGNVRSKRLVLKTKNGQTDNFLFVFVDGIL